MATKGNSHVRTKWKGLTRVLKSAACECLLIVLLFIDAAFSYFLTRFAQYCELQVPCILCSRLDHVFGNEKPGYFWTLFCSNHRSEASSLISCNIHGKLVDGRGMCENCLSSRVEENKSNSDPQRVSSEKLGIDPAGFGICDSQRLCLCCSKPLIPRPNAQKLPPLKSRGVAVAKPNVYLPRRIRGRNSTKKIKNKFSAPAVTPLGKTGFDPSSHVGYIDLEITSELEPEIPFSDDEVSNCMARYMDVSKKDSLVHSAPETPSKRLYRNWATRKQSDANDPYDFRCLHPDVLSENEFCDRKEQLTDQKTNPSILPELISLDDIPASSSPVEVPSYSAPVLSDLVSLVDKPPSVNVTENLIEASSGKLADVTETSNNENMSIDKNGKIDRAEDDTVAVHSTDEDLSDVHVSPVCVEEKGASITEEPMPTYNNGVNKDQSLAVQNSSGEGVPLSFNGLSPELQGNTDDFDEADNESNPYGVQSFHNYFMERNEFGSPGVSRDQSLPVQNSSGEGIHLRGLSDDFETTYESNPYKVQSFDNLFVTERSGFGSLLSLDGSTFNEIDGEDLVDRLKRLVEFYQKCMDELYRELEEERNASAIATNQAMAMITRLQEEKSALQMETLHYLRLMEEKAEYDGDALDKANDLLAEREKELQDLEAEIEFYRSTDETQMEALAEVRVNLSNGHVSVENMSTSFVKEFEEEKLYISERLRNLESKVSRFAHHGPSQHISDGEYFDEAANGGQCQQEFLGGKDKQATCEVEGNDLPLQKASSVSNGSAPQESFSTSVRKDQVVSKENSHMVSNGQKGSEDCNKTGLFGLENEISNPNGRLDALVADCKFLVHSLKSLQNGNEGLLFVQEILHELRELRKLGIRCRNMSVS